MRFYLNPSNQPGNIYCMGGTNERENMTLIANLTADALRRCGQEVKVGSTMEGGVKESNAWPADVHVPMHSNASKGGMARGARVFYGRAKEKAQVVWAYLDAVIGGAHVPPTQASLYEINKVNCDTIYIEAAFHDNPDDCKLLLESRTEIAEAICQGLCGAYGIKYVAPAADPVVLAGNVEQPSKWAEEAAEWAIKAGILKGDGKGNYGYKETVTLERLLTMLYRMGGL